MLQGRMWVFSSQSQGIPDAIAMVVSSVFVNLRYYARDWQRHMLSYCQRSHKAKLLQIPSVGHIVYSYLD